MEENNNLVQFIFNQNREVIAEQETEWTSYIRGSTLLASSADHARTYYHYASDEMSSVTHIVDDEKVLNEYEYDAWGEVVKSTETVSNRFKFNGQQLDPVTQQYYLRARFYNPVIARFTQEDTYRGDGLNLYAYCKNNPTYYVDPTGNICERTADVIRDKVKNNQASNNEIKRLASYDRIHERDRVMNASQQAYTYYANNPTNPNLNRMQLGRYAEAQATKVLKKWAVRNNVQLGNSGLAFQVRGAHSIPDMIHFPSRTLIDFKLTTKAIRKKQSLNFAKDFAKFSINYIFGQ